MSICKKCGGNSCGLICQTVLAARGIGRLSILSDNRPVRRKAAQTRQWHNEIDPETMTVKKIYGKRRTKKVKKPAIQLATYPGKNAAGGRPKPQYEHLTFERTQPWLKEGISRRAWYYRRAKLKAVL